MRAGLPYMVASALAFAGMGVFVKLAGQRIPSQEIVLARAVVALLLSLVMLAHAGVAPFGRHRGLLLLRGVFGFAGLSCVFYAVTRLPLAEATVIQYLHPVFTGALAWLFLGERVPRALGLAVPLSLAGVVFVAQPAALFGGEVSLPALGVLAALFGAVFSACAYVVVRRLSRDEHPLVIVLYFPLVTVPATLPFLVGRMVVPVGVEWLWLLLVGLCAQVGQIALTRGIQLETAARATSLSYLQVVFAAGFGVLVFGEVPTGFAVAGACLVMLGAYVAARRES